MTLSGDPQEQYLHRSVIQRHLRGSAPLDPEDARTRVDITVDGAGDLRMRQTS
jgi:hypothetical protein